MVYQALPFCWNKIVPYARIICRGLGLLSTWRGKKSVTIYLYLGAFGTLKAVGERKKKTDLERGKKYTKPFHLSKWCVCNLDGWGGLGWKLHNVCKSNTSSLKKTQVTFPHFLKPLLALVLTKPLQLLMHFTDQQEAHSVQTHAEFLPAQWAVGGSVLEQVQGLRRAGEKSSAIPMVAGMVTAQQSPAQLSTQPTAAEGRSRQGRGGRKEDGNK